MIAEEAECLAKISGGIAAAVAEHAIVAIAAAVIAIAFATPPGDQAWLQCNIGALLRIDREQGRRAACGAERVCHLNGIIARLRKLHIGHGKV